MGRTKRAQTSNQPPGTRSGTKLKRPRRAKKRSEVKLSAMIESVQLQQLFWTALLILVEWVRIVVSSLARLIIKQCSKGLFLLALSSDRIARVRQTIVLSVPPPANREFLKAIVGIQKISILFRYICVFPKECNKVTTKERFHRDLIGQCTNEWNY